MFWENFKRGWKVSGKSLSFIWGNKKLILFPLLTASVITACVGIYETVYYVKYKKHITSFFPESKRARAKAIREGREPKPVTLEYLVFGIIMTFCGIFFYTLFNTALSHASTQIFQGSPARIGSSLWHTLKRLPTLVMWSLTALAIHLLVNLMKKDDEDGKRRSSSWINLLGDALELAWAIATFLIVPVFAHEKLGTFKSIRRSAGLVKQTFGENLASTLALPLVTAAIVIIWLVLTFVTMEICIYLKRSYGVRVLHIGLPILGVLLFIAGFFVAVVSAATTVFKTAVYHYATGNLIGPFSELEVKTSFEQEKK